MPYTVFMDNSKLLLGTEAAQCQFECHVHVMNVVVQNSYFIFDGFILLKVQNQTDKL